MDLNQVLKTLLSNESLAGVAKKAGVDIDDVKKVVTSALPSLLGGATAQSKNKETAQGFAEALNQHAKSDTKNIGDFLKDIDIEDGAKILGHLFGQNTLSQAENISKKTGVSKANTGNILSLMAPLFMSSLGQQATTQQTTGAGVGSLMDSLFGMGQQQQVQQQPSLGDLFGAMMGSNMVQQQPVQQNPMEDFFNAMMGGMQQQQTQQQAMPDFFSNFVNSQQQAQQQAQQQQQANPFADLFGGLMGNTASNTASNNISGDNVTAAFNAGQNQSQGGMNGLDILGQLFGGR